jgi:hypothetical protein
VRFRSKFALKPREGEERVVNKFLLWPRCFGGRSTRWLRRADIVERVVKVDVGGSGEWGNYAWKWVEVAFAKEMPIEIVGCLEVWDEREAE